MAAFIGHAARRRELSLRWQTLAVEIKAPEGEPKRAIDLAQMVLDVADKTRASVT